MQILCILLALLVVATPVAIANPTKALPVSQWVSHPPEMLFDGKPLDPACVAATNPTEGPSVPQDLKTCAHAPEGMEIKSGVQFMPNGMAGYTYYCGEGPSHDVCGYSGYRYLGKVKDGFALETLENCGGTGQFSSIILLKRDGDTITSDIIQQTGDRCDGGIVDASVKDGAIEYAYNATLSELYNTYKTYGSFAPPAGSSLDCAAIIRKSGDIIVSIDLNRSEAQLKNDQLCFYNTYREHTKSGAYKSEEQIKEFFAAVEEKCAQEK